MDDRIRVLACVAGAAALLVASVLAWPARVHANPEPARVALAWQAPVQAGCATHAAITRQIARLAERAPAASAPGQSFRILAVVSKSDSGWLARVTLFDDESHALGSREVAVDAGDCRALDVPVTLVIATLLDGLREERAVPRPAAASSLDTRSHRVGVAAFLALAMRLGPSPSPSLGLGAGAEWTLGVPIVIDASGYLPGEQTDSSGQGARFFSFQGGASLCPRLFGTTLQLRLCGGAQAGAIWAKGVGLTEAESALRPLVIIAIGPQLLLALARNWSAQLSLMAGWLPVRPRFHTELEGRGEQTLETGRFALLARIGIIDFLR